MAHHHVIDCMVFQLGVFNFNEGSNLHLPGHSYTRNYLVIADIQRAFYFVSLLSASIWSDNNGFQWLIISIKNIYTNDKNLVEKSIVYL